MNKLSSLFNFRLYLVWNSQFYNGLVRRMGCRLMLPI